MARVVALVTTHAITRARERDPEFSRCKDLRRRVADEVVDAIGSCRVSKRCPTWARREWLERRPGVDHPGVSRFAWDQGERRCYVIRRAHRRDDQTGRIPAGAVGWLVVTTLVNGIGHVEGVSVRRRYAAVRSR